MKGASVERKKNAAILAAQIMTGLERGMDDVGRTLTQRARNKAPVDTGRLARSIHWSSPFMAGPLAMGVTVGTNVVYAAAHEFGSGIHAEDPAKRELIKIEAGFWTGKSKKKALKFHWPGHERPIYQTRIQSIGGEFRPYKVQTGTTDEYVLRYVLHPGVPAHPYLRPALKEVGPMVPRLVMVRIRREMARPV